MWKDYRPGIAQAVLVAGFVLVAGIVFTITRIMTHDDPTGWVNWGDQLATYDFSGGVGDWRTFRAGTAAAFQWNDRTETLDGSVRVGQGFVPTTTREMHRSIAVSTIIQRTRQPEGTTISAGVMCRADPDGNGYYFLIASTGRASIQKDTEGDPNLTRLAGWQAHDAIQPFDQPNRVTGVCAERYLALYVNGAFVLEARDDDFTRGLVGVALAGSAVDDAPMESLTANVRVAYDDVMLQSVALVGR